MEVRGRIWNTTVDGTKLFVRYGENEEQTVSVVAPRDIVEAARTIRIGYEGADSIFNVEGDNWTWLRWDGKYVELYNGYKIKLAQKAARRAKNC